MNRNFLDFEQPIAELEAKIEELRFLSKGKEIDFHNEIVLLKKRSEDLTRSIFSSLTPHQISRLARHPQRPYFLDYAGLVFTDFEEIHGDRHYADDRALLCGLARLEDMPVVILGHQKGRDTQENLARNFGMAKPEGYRKALRAAEIAERFSLPLLTFIDTPGAYPGIGAEERGQSEAIAYNIQRFANLNTIVIASIIGEGGSGGALAIGVADRVVMLENSVYSVISPEGCASILWKSAERASEAAEAMGITSRRLVDAGLVDVIVAEPLGGAHRNPELAAASLKQTLIDEIQKLGQIPIEKVVELRMQRLFRLGRYLH